MNAPQPQSATGQRTLERMAYRTKEACAVLGISRATLWRIERRGLIKSSRALRTRLYPRTEIERFLEATK